MSTNKTMRRPSVSIYEYPEDLNPFKDDEESRPDDQIVLRHPSKAADLVDTKENRNKFWTFGRSKKKKSNSFSIKSKWIDIFGKRKSTNSAKEPTNSVPSTYQRASYNNYPEVPSNRVSNDQKEFDEALGTLARRRKYTLENSSRYGSNLTVNGDPGRIYEGSPQETTASILNDLTPKPPARRFGQVSPKPTDEIPPLNYSSESPSKDDVNLRTPIPPKRGTLRSSQRLHPDEPRGTLTDENENMHEEFIFKRCSHDATRKSNLSINSCMSVGSVYQSGRKKRRAPLPPSLRGIETKENEDIDTDESKEIARVAENIEDLTQTIVREASYSPEGNVEAEEKIIFSSTEEEDDDSELTQKSQTVAVELNREPHNFVEIIKDASEAVQVDVELTREPEKPLEIVAEVVDDPVTIRKKGSSSNLSSTESFSVKEEIEKIERQIKLLETTEIRRRTSSFSNEEDLHETRLERGGSRRSLQENRRQFFRELTKPCNDRVKVELKELPRKQNDIKIVRLDDPPTTSEDSEVVPKSPVKIIELHISEPIRQKPVEFSTDLDVNPIPKPRRHSPVQLDSTHQLTNEENAINSL